jgi:membrane protein required for colicin V production
MYFAIVDIVIVGIIALFALRSAVRGFVKEFFSMADLVIGLLFAILFFRRAAAVIGEQFAPEMKTLADVISFAILFIAVFIAVKLLEAILRDIFAKIKLKSLDRLLGFFYGVVEGIVIVYLLLFLINIQPFFDPQRILEKSVLAEKLMQLITGNLRNVKDAVESIV